MTDHPMQPTPEQFAEWLNTAMEGKPMEYMHGKPGALAGDVARLAYAAGADAELEACADWTNENECTSSYGYELCAARRPPNVKQQALDDLGRLACQGAIPDEETRLLVFRIKQAIDTIPEQ